MNLQERAVKELEPHKIYTWPEILKAMKVGASAGYTLQGLIIDGRIEECLHPVLDVRGYRLRQ